MIDIDEVIARLHGAREIIGQKGTDGAADYEKVKGVPRLTPFLHVIPAQDDPLEIDGMGALPMVALRPNFDVVISVRNVTDATGRAGHSELKDIRQAVWRTLCGWVPTGMNEPVGMTRGRLLFMHQGVLQWADSFETAFIEVLENQ